MVRSLITLASLIIISNVCIAGDNFFYITSKTVDIPVKVVKPFELKDSKDTQNITLQVKDGKPKKGYMIDTPVIFKGNSKSNSQQLAKSNEFVTHDTYKIGVGSNISDNAIQKPSKLAVYTTLNLIFDYRGNRYECKNIGFGIYDGWITDDTWVATNRQKTQGKYVPICGRSKSWGAPPKVGLLIDCINTKTKVLNEHQFAITSGYGSHDTYSTNDSLGIAALDDPNIQDDNCYDTDVVVA